MLRLLGDRREPGARFPVPGVRQVEDKRFHPGCSGLESHIPSRRGVPRPPLPLSPPGRSRAREAPGGGAGRGLSRGRGRGEAAALGLGLKVSGPGGAGRAGQPQGRRGRGERRGVGAAAQGCRSPRAGMSAAEPCVCRAAGRAARISGESTSAESTHAPARARGGMRPGGCWASVLSPAVRRAEQPPALCPGSAPQLSRWARWGDGGGGTRIPSGKGAERVERFEASVPGLPIPAEGSGAASRQELLASRSPRQPRRSPAGSGASWERRCWEDTGWRDICALGVGRRKPSPGAGADTRFPASGEAASFPVSVLPVNTAPSCGSPSAR